MLQIFVHFLSKNTRQTLIDCRNNIKKEEQNSWDPSRSFRLPYEKALYINSEWKIYRSLLGHLPRTLNKELMDLKFYQTVPYLHIAKFMSIQHSRHWTLSDARARRILAYIVCYNVDSCITVVSESLLAFWIIADGTWGVRVIDDVFRTGFGDAHSLLQGASSSE